MKKYVKFLIMVEVLLLIVLGTCLAVNSTQNNSGIGAKEYDPYFSTEHFAGSGICQFCHDYLYDRTGRDVSIVRDWSSTMMANSSRDPLWQAKLRSELQRNPKLSSVLNERCSRCHVPMANTEAHYFGDPIDVYGNFLSSSSPYYDVAIDGVSCTLCHQIKNSKNLGTLAGSSGKFSIGTYANPVERRIYGSHSDVFIMPMRHHAGYTPTYGPHVRTSKLCASCHDLKTPYVDENGNILSTTSESEFPEQMVYSEWDHSGYADRKSCQDCHFPTSKGVVISARPPWLDTVRNNLGIHKVVGANRLLLDILGSNRRQLGVTGSNFPATIRATDQMLSSAAKISLEKSSLADGRLEFTLGITSSTGHKLPSGIPLRRLILHVTVRDDSGKVVFESGYINDDGSVAGLVTDYDQSKIEPHYNIITAEDQVQVYESVMQDYLGAVTYTLMRGASYAKDNRLLPAGFDKAKAKSDIRVVGRAMDDDDFQGGGDIITYSLLGMSSESYTVFTELVYQGVGFSYINDLLKDSAKEITSFKNMYDASDQKSIAISSNEFKVKG